MYPSLFSKSFSGNSCNHRTGSKILFFLLAKNGIKMFFFMLGVKYSSYEVVFFKFKKALFNIMPLMHNLAIIVIGCIFEYMFEESIQSKYNFLVKVQCNGGSVYIFTL